jgi:hypothetical protein
MSDEKKITDNGDMILADLDTYRTGEAQVTSKLNPKDEQALGDLKQISKLFSDAKPETSEIPESVDNVILGHIKQKSREIRRERKVVHLFPRYRWAAAAVMGVMVCVISFKLFYNMEKPVDNSIKDNTAKILTKLSEDTNEKNKLIFQNQEHAKPGMVKARSFQEKHKLKRAVAESPVKTVHVDKSTPIPAQTAEDIDGNGSVNIIDAYIMDRRLMSGVAMPKKLDLNGDGNINREDINSIIKTSVSLEGGKV